MPEAGATVSEHEEPAQVSAMPPVDAEEGLRERKKRLTRHAIHHAALTLVTERGLDHVTTDEIAARADVSARTFFNYFPTKDAAVLGMPPDLADRLGDSLRERPAAEDLFTALTTVVRTWFIKVDGDPLRDMRRTVVGRDSRLAAAMIGANRDLEAALVRAAADRGDVDDELTARIMTAAVIGTARAAYVHAQASPDTNDTGERVASEPRSTFVAALDTAFDMLARGLTTH